MKKYIFITHSSHDGDKAKKVRDYLETNGIQCWMAPRDIPVGAEWAEAILDGIENASGMLLVFSSNSNNSPQVRREIERAIHNRIPIFPVRIEDVVPSKAMEYYISSNHWMDAFGGSFETSLLQLSKSIKSRLLLKDTASHKVVDASEEFKVKGRSDKVFDNSEEKNKGLVKTEYKTHFFQKIPKKFFVSILILFLAIVTFFIVSSLHENPPLETPLIVSNEIDDTFAKVIYEDGLITSIQETMDKGFLVTGVSYPYLIQNQNICEVWVKKLDSEGNEEWCYSSIIDLKEEFFLREINAVELSDSSIVCAYEIPTGNTILPDSALTNRTRNELSFHLDSTDRGSGFEIVHLGWNGEIISKEFIGWEYGAWEICKVKTLLVSDNDALYVNVSGENASYGNSVSVLLKLEDINQDTISGIQQRILGHATECIAIENGSLVFDRVDINTGVYIVQDSIQSNLVSISNTSEEISIVDKISAFLFSDMSFSTIPTYLDQEIFIGMSPSIRLGRISMNVICCDLNGSILWNSSVNGDRHTMANIAIRTRSSDVLFAGETSDSLGTPHPFYGRFNSAGELLWNKTIPIEGRVMSINETESGELLLGISHYPNSYLFKTDSSGEFDLALLNQFSESEMMQLNLLNDATGEINSEQWDISDVSVVGFSEFGGRQSVMHMFSLRQYIPTLLSTKNALSIDSMAEISFDFLTENSFGTSYIKFNLIPEQNRSNTNEVDAFASFQWNSGYSNTDDYLPHSICISASEIEDIILSDSLHINFGTWNQIKFVFDGEFINFILNDNLLASTALPDSVYERNLFLEIEIVSTEYVFYLDSIMVKNSKFDFSIPN